MNKRDVLQDELEEALQQQGCALCRISMRGVARTLEHLLYDMVNDPDVRAAVRGALGYCNRHAWQMREMRGNALGLALLYRDGVLELETQLSTVKPDARTRPDKLRSQAARAAKPRTMCPACKHQHEIEARFIHSFWIALRDDAFVGKFAISDGLCRLHVEGALSHAPDAAVMQTFLDAQRAIHQRLIADLYEFIRKSDFKYAHEGMGREGDAWIRAVELLSGPRS